MGSEKEDWLPKAKRERELVTKSLEYWPDYC